MFGYWMQRSATRTGTNGRGSDRRRGRRNAFSSEMSRMLRIEPLERRLLLTSDFSFASASVTQYATGNSAGFVAVGDLDGVNGIDLVVANDYGSTTNRTSDLSVMLNNGHGVFSQRHIDLPNNSRPRSVDVKDVDGINGPDLVVAAIGASVATGAAPVLPAGSVFVILNNGDGTFGTAVSHSAGDGPIDVVAADFDGEGRLDYVTANFRSNDISVLLEQAGGGMRSSRLPAGTTPVAVAVGAINDDAHLDLAVANVDSNDISLFLGDGQGGFTVAAPLTGLNKPTDVLLGDIDDDGDTDLVAVNYGSSQLSTYLNDGVGVLELHAEMSVSAAQSVAFGDLNHDGLEDLLVTGAAAGSVTTLMNIGAGNYATPNETTLNPAWCSGDPNQGNLLRSKCSPQNIVAEQLNADDDVDVVIADTANGISLYLNNQATTISGRTFEDLNADGDDENGGDPALAGVPVDLYLDSNFNGRFDRATDQHVGRRNSTTGRGAFLFDKVGPGTHFLVQQVRPGSTQTAPTAGGVHTIVTQTGVDVTGRNFGSVTQVDIGGRKFNDINGDGDDENGSDPGMGGVIIQLHRDGNGNSRFDGASIDPQIATRTTATGTGAYSFADNGPGTYFVTEQVPAGWDQTSPASGVHTIVARIGTDATNRDFGNHFTNIAISGRKFDDVNGDGDDENGGDPGLGGVIIELYRDSNGNGIRETSRDALVRTVATSQGTGFYSFNDNGPGIYFVSERLPAGSTQTVPLTGFYTIFAQSGVNATNRDFGNEVSEVAPTNITISGRKFNDVNRDGDDENGSDPGLGGVVIELYQDSNSSGTFEIAFDTLIATRRTTAGTGAYSFANTSPGTYFVSEQVPNGSTQTAPAAGFYTVVAQSGVDAPNRDFGNFTNVVSGPSPIAVDDAFQVDEASSNTLLDVLLNDTAGQNSPIQIVDVGPAVRGSVSIADDMLLYTPGHACGNDRFTYTIEDQSGIQRTATVSIQVQPEIGTGQAVLFCLQTVDLNGDPVNSVPVGAQFDLQVLVKDTRLSDGDSDQFDRRGVGAAYLDVQYDDSLVSTAGAIVYGPDYVNGQHSDTSITGLIDEAGAFQTSRDGPLGTDQLLLFSVRVTAEQPGFASFQGDPSDIHPLYETLLFQPPTPRVPAGAQRFVNTDIAIVGPAPEGESLDVNADGLVTPIDALLVVNELNDNGSHEVLAEGEAFGPLNFDTNRDGFVSPADVLYVINHINSQIAVGEGEEVDANLQDRVIGQSLEPASLDRHIAHLAQVHHRELDDSTRRLSEASDHRADVPARGQTKHDVVLAAWPEDSRANRRRDIVEIGSLGESDLEVLEFWRDIDSTDGLS